VEVINQTKIITTLINANRETVFRLASAIKKVKALLNAKDFEKWIEKELVNTKLLKSKQKCYEILELKEAEIDVKDIKLYLSTNNKYVDRRNRLIEKSISEREARVLAHTKIADSKEDLENYTLLPEYTKRQILKYLANSPTTDKKELDLDSLVNRLIRPASNNTAEVKDIISYLNECQSDVYDIVLLHLPCEKEINNYDITELLRKTSRTLTKGGIVIVLVGQDMLAQVLLSSYCIPSLKYSWIISSLRYKGNRKVWLDNNRNILSSLQLICVFKKFSSLKPNSKSPLKDSYNTNLEDTIIELLDYFSDADSHIVYICSMCAPNFSMTNTLLKYKTKIDIIGHKL
jgi:hypothetical protein